ncbi:hypothetical protein K438DRAFT_1935043 [Mycena galopus ATCC 62051]|nr:hypothetical protein K438DRAFT_1935043 [Mycena galopus ATCC 62051]
MKEYGAIDYISGNNEEYGRFYILKKTTPAGDQLIVIQASAVVPKSHMATEVADKCTPEWNKQYTYGLEIIHTLLPTIRFGHTNWGYLVGSNNNYRIIHKHQSLYVICFAEVSGTLPFYHRPIVTEIPWCPLVDEREIEITGFLYAEDRFGVWNGREVDVFMAWDTSYVGHLQKRMAAHRLLMERDLEHLTYRAVAHVVRNGTSEICGLITEASYGRIFEYRDKSVVYKAIAQIERAGLLFTGIHTSNIMITDDGQVRLLSLCALMRQSDDPIVRGKEFDYWHWERLEAVFQELEPRPNLVPPPRKQRPTSCFLPEFPAPVRGLKLVVYLVLVCHSGDPLGHRIKDDEDVKPRVLDRHNRPPTNHNHKRTYEVLVFDTPISARSLGGPKTRLHARAEVPYHKLDKSDKLLRELLFAQSWRSFAL